MENISLSNLIIGLTVALSYWAWQRPDFLSKLIFNPGMISNRNEYHRFVSSLLIHADWMHLLFNMFVFYSFGNACEQLFNYRFGILGPYIFVAFYLLSGAIAHLPDFIKHKNNYGYNSLGASGSVSALLMMYITIFPFNNLQLYFFIELPGFVIGLGYMAWSYYESRKNNSTINHLAHFIGGAVGIIMALVFFRSLMVNSLASILEYLPF